MHHRAQLMADQRMLGIVPHLTRRGGPANVPTATAGAAAPARS